MLLYGWKCVCVGGDPIQNGVSFILYSDSRIHIVIGSCVLQSTCVPAHFCFDSEQKGGMF